MTDLERRLAESLSELIHTYSPHFTAYAGKVEDILDRAESVLQDYCTTQEQHHG